MTPPVQVCDCRSPWARVSCGSGVTTQRDGVGWRLSIANARDEIAEFLEDSPSLRSKIGELVARRFPAARSRAALETGLPEETFPRTCPFFEEQMLDAAYWADG